MWPHSTDAMAVTLKLVEAGQPPDSTSRCLAQQLTVYMNAELPHMLHVSSQPASQPA